ncbi:MAG: GTPase HflX [Pseudomonadota bacterium]
MERIYRSRVPSEEVASWDLLKRIAASSREIRRQVGVIIDRKGKIESVIVGENRSIRLPNLPESRAGRARLAGYRILHTHLHSEGVTQKDVNELVRGRLDLAASVGVGENGVPGLVHIVHIAPDRSDSNNPVTHLEPVDFQRLDLPFQDFVRALEEELERQLPAVRKVERQNLAILCVLRTDAARASALFEENLKETHDLCRTVGLEVAETVVQHREKPDAKYLLGEGKMRDILLRASQLGVATLLFQQNLSPNQLRHLSDMTQLKILDRTQLILDIFAQRAKSHEGKLQVELAQLRYNLPRLREWDTGLSRLVGGIGGRGPGETKLEIHRRRARDRMNRLEREIGVIAEKRATRRALRQRRNMPVVSIVGYTNAGKTTLLNSLTHAEAFTENRPFATLDPFSKRLRFPHDRDVILTDTVGFLRDLPKDLLFAFRATLEEIGLTDLILHVVDAAVADSEERIGVVNGLLEELGFGEVPQLLVFNKADLAGAQAAERIAQRQGGIAITATDSESCRPLLYRLESQLWPKTNEQRPGAELAIKD